MRRTTVVVRRTWRPERGLKLDRSPMAKRAASKKRNVPADNQTASSSGTSELVRLPIPQATCHRVTTDG